MNSYSGEAVYEYEAIGGDVSVLFLDFKKDKSVFCYSV